MFKIVEYTDQYFVVPTAEYLLRGFDQNNYSSYDSNWEIYKLCKCSSATEFFQKMGERFNLKYSTKKNFPYIQLYFSKYSEAKIFLNFLEQQFQDWEEN